MLGSPDSISQVASVKSVPFNSVPIEPASNTVDVSEFKTSEVPLELTPLK